MVIILGTLMYIIEGQQNGFDNIPKAIYWAVVTLTTVGYGDVVPITALGKTVAVFIMMLGYAIIAVPTGIVASEFTRKKSRERQDKIIEKEDIILEKMKSLEDKIDKLSKK
jgi:voltage-gated potassium channel